MNDLTVTDLAAEIRQKHALAIETANRAVQYAREAGELLLQAKATIAHGAWGEWLKENCDLSERTAQGYMRLARELPKLDAAKAQRVADLPLRQALKELSKPVSKARKPNHHEVFEATPIYADQEPIRELVSIEQVLPSPAVDAEIFKPDPDPLAETLREKIFRLGNRGMTWAEISKIVDRDTSRISRHYRKALEDCLKLNGR